MRLPSLGIVLGLVVWGQPRPAGAQQWHNDSGCRWAALPVPLAGKIGFTAMPPAEAGILFSNWLPQQRYLTNQILLNGSGVAAGDIDGDGLCDLFFCGIDRPSVLYRNLGNWKFQDITADAGVACPGQASTGAVFADVDGDGHLDLLVNSVGGGTRLFLNDGRGHFHEATEAWGLRNRTGSMSLALADVDGDGFLDLYVANYRSSTVRDEIEVKLTTAVTNGHYNVLAVNGRPVRDPDLKGRYTIDPVMGLLENGEADAFYHNNGHEFVKVSWTDGSFLDEDGRPTGVPYDWGLSAMFRDLNGDGAPDLYVCNDFHSPDRIWLNDGHGRFRAIPRLALRQTSLFSMGVDFADLDRDGRDEFFVADMLSRRHARRQVQLMDRRPTALPLGAIENRPQYSRNTLFWNRGDGTYAEIAHYSGVEASEWTWCPVFLDVDLDGYEDLLMVTGHLRDAQNIDIARRIEQLKREHPRSRLEQLSLRKLFQPLDVPNLAFRNRGDLTFEEMGKAWGFDSRKISQGVALADLDNDGDLDVVINCLNEEPLLLRNEVNRPRLAVRLKGLPPNTRGIGARIIVSQPGLPEQSQEIICGGRYLSGDDAERVFAANLDNNLTIEVRWRSGRDSRITNAKANRIYEIDEPTGATAAPGHPQPVESQPLFADVSELIQHHHVEQEFDDYERQPLLPHKLSQLGPGIAWFDLDGDGWEDLLISSGRGGRLAVFKNDQHGGFVPWSTPPFDVTAGCDQTAVVGWRESGGIPRLLVGSANYADDHTNSAAVLWYDLAAKNILEQLPGTASSTGPLAVADPQGDGQFVVFVGGRVIPGRFPAPAASLVLRSRSGTLRAEPDSCAALAHVGLVSGAIWSDLDNDGVPELVLACEGGPVRVFALRQGQLVDRTDSLGFGQYIGLWNSVAVGDFDGDGRMDILAGNWGKNTKYESHLARPFHWYYGECDDGMGMSVVEAYYDSELDKIVPWRDWETLARAMPFIQERYHSFTEFSTAGVAEFMGQRMRRFKDIAVNTLASLLFLNRGDHFEARLLPPEAQFAPIFGIAVGDVDGDGHEDVLVSQNFFEVAPTDSRLDAGRGLWLRGDGRGGLESVPAQKSGLAVYGDGRAMALCDYDHDGRPDIVVGQNANATKLYRNVGGRAGLRVLLNGPSGNPLGIGAQLRLEFAGGRLGPAREVHAGGGYWSQDSATQVLGSSEQPLAVVVRWPGGKTTRAPLSPGAREIRVSANAQ